MVAFEGFLVSFRMDPPGSPDRAWSLSATGFRDLMERAAGCSFEGGLYRLHTARSATGARALVENAFPEFVGRSEVFGMDWLGRQFALDPERKENGEPLVVMFEPGTGQVLEISATFLGFHDTELPDFPEEALARAFFLEWARSNDEVLPLALTECVGYRVPLFLGGLDEVENLEVSDLDVYWSICGQLRRAILDGPPGPKIRDVQIDD